MVAATFLAADFYLWFFKSDIKILTFTDDYGEPPSANRYIPCIIKDTTRTTPAREPAFRAAERIGTTLGGKDQRDHRGPAVSSRPGRMVSIWRIKKGNPAAEPGNDYGKLVASRTFANITRAQVHRSVCLINSIDEIQNLDAIEGGDRRLTCDYDVARHRTGARR